MKKNWADTIKSKMHRRLLNLAVGVIQIPKLSKCTSGSLNLLIGSCGVQITVSHVNHQRVKLTGHLTCGAHMSDAPPSAFHSHG